MCPFSVLFGDAKWVNGAQCLLFAIPLPAVALNPVYACLCACVAESGLLWARFQSSGAARRVLSWFISSLFLPFFEPLVPLSALCLAIVFDMEVFVQEGGFLRTDDACQVLFAGFPHAFHTVESLQQ